MDWFSLVPPVSLCIALLFGPGLLIAASARLRGFDAVAVAPALSIGAVSVSAIVAPMVGVRWALWVPLVAALVTALVVFLLAGLLHRRHAEPPRPGVLPLEPSRWFSREQLHYWVAAVLAAVMMMRHMRNSLGNPHWFSQTFDNSFHLNVIRWIVDHGNASSLFVTSMTTAPGHGYFYPAAWHDVVSLLYMDGGAGGIPEATNSMVLVVACLVWPLGLLFLVRSILPLNLPAVYATAALASAFAAFPILLIEFGVLYPNFLGVALLPSGLGLVVQVLRVTAIRRIATGQGILLGIGAALGIATAHPNAVMSLIIMSVPVVAVVLVRTVLRMVRKETRVWVGTLQVVLCLLSFVVVWILWGIIRPAASAANWDPAASDSAAFGEAMLNSPLGMTEGQWWLSILVWVGLFLMVRSRRNLWLPLVYALVLYYYISIRSLNWDQGRMWVTGVWYNDSYRVAALLPVVSVPLAAYAVHVFSAWLMRQPRAQRAIKNPRRLLATSTVLVFVVVLAFTQFSRSMHQISDISWRRYALDNHALLVAADEKSVLNKVDDLVPSEDTILVNPYTGGAMAYALTGRKVSAYHTIYTPNDDYTYLNQNLDKALTDPKVCQLVRKHHAYYTLDFGTQEVNDQSHVSDYAGLQNLVDDGVGRTVAQTGGSRLIEITACE